MPPADAFILLEVLLGVAILASSLLALNAAIGQCIRSARAIDGYTLSEVLIDQIDDQRHVLQFAARIGEADVDVFDVFGLHQFESFLDLAHCNLPFR